MPEIGLHNVGEHFKVRLALLDGLIEERAEVELSGVSLHLVVAFSGNIGSLALELEGGNILLVIDNSEIDLGCLAISDGPLHEAGEGCEVNSGGGVLFCTELRLEIFELLLEGCHDFNITLGGRDSAHLANEFSMVKEEELDVGGLGLRLGTEKCNKHLEDLDKSQRLFVLKNFVDALYKLFGNQGFVRSAGFSELSRSVRVLLSITLKVGLLITDVILAFLRLFPGFNRLFLQVFHLDIKITLVFTDDLDLSSNRFPGVHSVAVVSSLNFGCLIEGLLAIVALLFDKGKQLLLGLSVQLVSILLVYKNKGVMS